MLILKQIYYLTGLLIVSAAIVAAILVQHTRTQQSLYDRITHFHAPTIFYMGRLIATLQEKNTPSNTT